MEVLNEKCMVIGSNVVVEQLWDVNKVLPKWSRISNQIQCFPASLVFNQNDYISGKLSTSIQHYIPQYCLCLQQERNITAARLPRMGRSVSAFGSSYTPPPIKEPGVAAKSLTRQHALKRRSSTPSADSSLTVSVGVFCCSTSA